MTFKVPTERKLAERLEERAKQDEARLYTLTRMKCILIYRSMHTRIYSLMYTHMHCESAVRGLRAMNASSTVLTTFTAR
jgi:hypothetical protein